MATGSQPAVEGSGSGATVPVPAVSGDGAAPRSGAQPLSRSGRPDPPSRSGPNGPAGRSPGPAPATLPVGKAAAPSLHRGPRHRHDAKPRVVSGRRTRRVVRKIDVWTVLKMSILFYLCVFLVFLIAGIVLWNIAQAFNVIHSVEKFARSIFDLQKFTFRPGVVLQSTALGGSILVLLATGANVLAALLYNLISDVVGGVQFIVLEESAPPPE